MADAVETPPWEQAPSGAANTAPPWEQPAPVKITQPTMAEINAPPAIKTPADVANAAEAIGQRYETLAGLVEGQPEKVAALHQQQLTDYAELKARANGAGLPFDALPSDSEALQQLAQSAKLTPDEVGAFLPKGTPPWLKKAASAAESGTAEAAAGFADPDNIPLMLAPGALPAKMGAAAIKLMSAGMTAQGALQVAQAIHAGKPDEAVAGAIGAGLGALGLKVPLKEADAIEAKAEPTVQTPVPPPWEVPGGAATAGTPAAAPAEAVQTPVLARPPEAAAETASEPTVTPAENANAPSPPAAATAPAAPAASAAAAGPAVAIVPEGAAAPTAEAAIAPPVKEIEEAQPQVKIDEAMPPEENEVAGFGGGSRKAPSPVTPPPFVTARPVPQVNPVAQFMATQLAPVKTFAAPQTIDAGARGVGNALRHFMGENALALARADEAMHSFRKEFDQTPVPANYKYDPAQPLPHNYAVIDAMERDPKQLPQRYQDLAATFQKEFQSRITEIQKYAPNALQHLIENYFPHIWQDPKRAEGVMAQVSSRLFQGRREFLKERSLPFFADGLAKGLKPISDNPVDLLIAKMHSMDKFLMALKATSEFKATGAMKFKYLFERLPDGWRTIDDPAFIVQRPPVVSVTEAYDQFQRAKLGDILKDIGVSYKRVASLGGERWAEADRGTKEIRAQVGSSEDTLWHELGHHLDWQFPALRDALQFRGNGKIATQLRAIADLRKGGQQVSGNHERYLRSSVEKMAEIFRTYVAAPDKFKQIAPDVLNVVNKFLDTQPKLRDQLQELQQPGMAHDSETTEMKLGGMQVLGHWMMPEGAAQVITNHLSPGLSRFALYRTFKAASNILNAAQLGLSGFHLGFTSLDAAVSRLAIGLEDLSKGHAYKAAKTFASVPVSPVTNILKGRRMMQEALHPGSTDADTAALVKALELGGGRIGQDRFWQTDFMRRLKRAWNEGTATGYLKSIPLAPLTAVEQAMRPIMEYVVPRQKLGVFADMAQRELARLGPGATVQDSREAMRKAWDSVDNRMGQVVYDNLFYNRVVKDLALTAFRAYGWQLGKYREGIGAVADAAAAGKRLEVSHRMAYAMALPIMVGTIGGTMTYLMTGQRPQEVKDYFMPRTGQVDANGNAARLNLPSYMKDVLAYSKHPGTSLTHSLNPMFSGIADLLDNKDFYDVQIRNPDDPLWKQGSEVAQFAAKQFIPFSVSGTQQLHEMGSPLRKEILPFFGITPVPSRMTMTPAQELAAEITGANLPGAPRTQEQFQRSKLVTEIVQEFRNGQNTAGRTAMAQGFQTGQLNARTVQTIIDKLKYTPLQFQVSHMDVPAAMRVWRVATPAERVKLTPMVELKIAGSKTLAPDEMKEYMSELSARSSTASRPPWQN